MILRRFRRFRRFRDRNRPDLHFPGLTRGQAGELRSALRRTLAEKGATVRYDGRHAVIQHPRHGRVTVNLENLIGDVAASQHPKAARSMARAFVASVLEAEPVDTLTTADLYAGLRLRIAPTTHLVPEEEEIISAATLREFTDDTVITLVLDTERSIQTMPLDRLREHDDLATLVRAAHNNLRTELTDLRIHAQTHPGSEEHPGWAPDFDLSRGVLFAMPTRHILLVREISTGEDLLEGLGRLAPVAAQVAVDGAHAVSPLLHLWHEGEVTTLTSFDQEARELKITPTPYLLELMAGDGDTGF